MQSIGIGDYGPIELIGHGAKGEASNKCRNV